MSNVSDNPDHIGDPNEKVVTMSELTTQQEYEAAHDMLEAAIENQANPQAARWLQTLLAQLEWLWEQYDTCRLNSAPKWSRQISAIHKGVCDG